jgi:hypothetical protein
MSQLNREQLESVREQIQNKKTIVGWLQKNKIEGVKPAEIVEQLKATYDSESITQEVAAMREQIRGNAIGGQVRMTVTRLLRDPKLTEAQCDKLLEALQEAMLEVTDKRETL